MTKLTKEQVKFFIETMTDDMHNTTQHKIAETLLSKFDECESLQAKLLAYEQAAEKPYGYLEPCDFPRTTATVYPEKDKYAFMPLYAAPVLPKQPEPVVLYMGRELISKEGLELIRDGVSEATQPESMCMASAILGGGYPAQPVIPEGLIKAINRLLDNDGSRGCFDALEQHRAKTELERLLAAAQQNEPQNIPENIPAQPVSKPYKLAKSPEICTWSSDSEGLWLGGCGVTWVLFDNGPNENGLKYCPSCGKKVSVIAAPAQESE